MWDDLKKPITEFNDPDWSNKFHIWRMDWDERTIALSVVQEVLTGLRVVKAFGQEDREQERFLDQSSLGMRARIRLSIVVALLAR